MTVEHAPHGRRAMLGLGAAFLASPGRAQSLPEQLRILCGQPPGSIPDTVARLVAAQLAAGPAPRVVVENRPGAAGQIAVQALIAGPADGSTLLLGAGNIATTFPHIYSRLPYQPDTDLKPVALAAVSSLALAVGPATPAGIDSLPAFLEWAKRNPALANVGSPGTGTPPHILAAALFRRAGVNWQHIAYAGGPPAMTDLLGGRIAALVLPEGILRQPSEAGRLRVLATSGATRSRFLPNVPSLSELGHEGLVMEVWFGFFLPGRSGASVVEVTAAALRQALARPAVVTALAENGMVTADDTPAALGARIVQERQQWAVTIRESRISAD